MRDGIRELKDLRRKGDKMESKIQSFEVVLFTTDEEVDGKTLIDTAIRQYVLANKRKHIENVSVEEMKNEWTEGGE